ncbi:hypothetical protein GCM10011390_00160 [Aureimonas endophytica]|uniref:Uncharacterized protein n=1 Tax=Aureimonas endophytica TaxID=2027858 RepID=A0A917E0I7_9HYPH|nr:hypothetical protein [Aureimonas endophytica]GGD85551.1 hypothetical protein GCM10011390_00160 [Aureimonas endophytica]
MNPLAILIGLAAGFASALLFAGVVLQSMLAVVLSLIAPLPIFIASLGWGSLVGFVAAGAAAVTIGAITGAPASGLLLFAAIALLAAAIGHVAGLARLADDGRPAGPNGAPALDWFPVPRILFAIALVAALACLFVGWLVGFDAAAIGDELGRALSTQIGDPASQDQVDRLAHQVVTLIPFLQPALLVAMLAVCLYFAASITRLSGKLARPRDDLPAKASALPRPALLVFGAGLVASFAPGTLGNVGAVVAGSFGMGFTLAGLAAIHRMTRATRSRGLILFALYMAILLLTFPLFVATIIGLSETARRPSAIPSP